jgi:hypothetical protein
MSDHDRDAPSGEVVLLDATEADVLEEVDDRLLTELQALLGASNLSIRACLATLCHVLAIGITAADDEETQKGAAAAVVTTILNIMPAYAEARQSAKEDKDEQPVPDRRH